GISHTKRIAVSLAGPFAGFLLGGVVFLSGVALPDLFVDRFVAQTYIDLMFVNLGWGIFNLLPILPLDGGNVAYSIEQIVTKKSSGVITRALSFLIAAGVGLLALSIGQLWIVFLMAIFALNNGRALFQLFQTDQDESVRPLLDQARDAVKND